MGYQWKGKQPSGAARMRREIKRAEAEARNKSTEETRRKVYRLGPVDLPGDPRSVRTDRSIKRYRDAFKAEHGFYPGEES